MKSYLRRKYSLYDPIVAYDEDGVPMRLSDIAFIRAARRFTDKVSRIAWNAFLAGVVADVTLTEMELLFERLKSCGGDAREENVRDRPN